MEPPESEKPLTPGEWEALLRHSERGIRRGLAKMGFAQEIVEEALLSAVLKIVERQAAGLDIRRDSILAFVWRVAYNCAIDMQRKIGREQPLENPVEGTEQLLELVSPRPDPEREVITRVKVGRAVIAARICTVLGHLRGRCEVV